MLADLMRLTLIVCFVVDVSGFIDGVKRRLFRFVKGTGATYVDYGLKPLDCSLCMTWWTGLGYLWITGRFDLGGIVCVGLFAHFAEIVTLALFAVKDLLGGVIDRMGRIFGR